MHWVSYLSIPVLVYGNNVITVVSDDDDDKKHLTNKGTYYSNLATLWYRRFSYGGWMVNKLPIRRVLEI